MCYSLQHKDELILGCVIAWFDMLLCRAVCAKGPGLKDSGLQLKKTTVTAIVTS